MTRSTESESVSIARYDFQNVRRESLLSQNRTASEEKDTNALSDTEEENTNALLFDHEMIKISISIELNAWISAHEADDIVVFIKYMYQDVNEINITLKAAQTRLQKEMRNKNVIIHHLETASSQQSTLISEDRFSKSIKLLNSSLFEDSSQNVNN